MVPIEGWFDVLEDGMTGPRGTGRENDNHGGDRMLEMFACHLLVCKNLGLI